MLTIVKQCVLSICLVLFISAPVRAESALLGSLWESGGISGLLLSLDYGDVDGDGVNDIVYVSRGKLALLEFQEKEFKEKLTLKSGNNREFHRVHLGDWDQDGVIEVLVNGFIRDRVYSWLYRVEGKNFVLEQEFDKLLMPLSLGTGQNLYTQSMHGKWQWSDDINVLKLKNGKWQEEKTQIRVNRGIGGGARPLFAITAFDGNLISLGGDHKLTVRKPNGKKVWKSSMHYGMAIDYLDIKEKDPLGIKRENRFYIPSRMLVKDKNLLVIKNDGYLKSIVGTLPNIKSSQLLTLVWTAGGFQELKTTPRLNGAITDIRFIDFDKDGMDELMVSYLMKKSGYFEAYRGYSTVIAVIPTGLAPKVQPSSETTNPNSQDPEAPKS